jgi:hypothetical protein
VRSGVGSDGAYAEDAGVAEVCLAGGFPTAPFVHDGNSACVLPQSPWLKFPQSRFAATVAIRTSAEPWNGMSLWWRWPCWRPPLGSVHASAYCASAMIPSRVRVWPAPAWRRPGAEVQMRSISATRPRVIVEGGVHAEFWQIHLILGIEHRPSTDAARHIIRWYCRL